VLIEAKKGRVMNSSMRGGKTQKTPLLKKKRVRQTRKLKGGKSPLEGKMGENQHASMNREGKKKGTEKNRKGEKGVKNISTKKRRRVVDFDRKKGGLGCRQRQDKKGFGEFLGKGQKERKTGDPIARRNKVGTLGGKGKGSHPVFNNEGN